MKKYSEWKDVEIRTCSHGTHYLLQMKIREDGKKKFRNRRIDHDGFPYILFHGFQGIREKILK